MSTIRLNCGVGITGTTSVTTEKNGDSKTVKITTTGSMNAYKIPAVIVFCEDKLAKDIITHSLQGIDDSLHCSFKFIICGSWRNIITSIAGSLLYSDELKESGNTKVLSAVGVIDGDISHEDISKIITECYEGDCLPEKLSAISERISNHIISFKIPERILDLKVFGKPECNIKAMIEEINEQDIDDILKPRMDSLTTALDKSKEENNKAALELELFFLQKEKDETLKVISLSKGLNKKISKRKNYHAYFSLMERSIGNEHYHSYPRAHFINLILFRIIVKFNNRRWVEYVTPVTDFLIPIAEQQRERFTHNTYNNQIID
ncbi:hypothetical protein SH579_05210 [Raoultella ornithinolytica]|uniref:hypothetical protein n=1 Tax=Raoultella ornithinolytica TaxID=54291 RepID=UPI002A5B06F2|nr:hypothetical protein [Raoultella ornithinolytica]WPO20339.1 hypothetical protein SH579_05210 [Raoultella ornithinolytica]